MKIRNYKNSDFLELEKLLKDTELFVEGLDNEKVFSSKIKHDPDSIIVGSENGKIIGVVVYVFDPWVSTIFHLGVHPSYQRKGFGSKLLNEAEKRLKQRGVSSVGIYVSQLNDEVIDFYEKREYYFFENYDCLEKKF